MNRFRLMPNYRYYNIEETSPLTLDKSVGKPLRDYKIYGNTVRNGTPTPENPIEVQSVGNRTKNLFNEGLLLAHSDVYKIENGYVVPKYPAIYNSESELVNCIKSALKANVTYTLSRKVSNYVTGSSGLIQFRAETDGSKVIVSVTSGAEIKSTTFSLTQDEIDSITRIYVYGHTENPTVFEYIQLEEVLENNNLFDFNSAIDDTNWEGTPYKRFLPFVFKKGVHYIVSMSDNLCWADRFPYTSGQIALCVNSKNAWGGQTIGNSTMASQPPTTINIYNETEDRYLMLFSPSDVDKKEIFETLFPNFHISAIEYKPYGKYEIPVAISGKNLFDAELLLTHPNAEKIENGYQITKYPATYGRGSNIADTYPLIEHIKSVLKPGITYTFSRKFNGYIANNDGVISFRNSQNQNIFRTVYGEGVRTTTFTLTQEQIDSIASMVIYGRSDSVTIYEYIQLEESENATEYEPYKEPKEYNIYLDEPLRKIGDYGDYIDFKNNTVVREIAKYIITGDEASWSDRDLGYTAYGIVFRNTNLVPLPVMSTGVALCNHFPYGNISATTAVFSKALGERDFQFKILDGQLGISKDEVASTRLEKWLAWLKARYNEGNPVILTYVLETPVETNIDLPTIKSYKGTNIITVDTIVPVSNIAVQYYK